MKRQHHEIKDAILDALSRYPQNSSQLSKRIQTSQSTVERHLEELRDLHRVQKVATTVRGKTEEVWELVGD